MTALVLDANTLLVWLVGRCDISQLGKARRVNEYSAQQFDLIDLCVGRATALISVPNVLTQVSDLMGDGDQVIVSGANREFERFLSALTEVYVPSAKLAVSERFQKLGLADSAILECILSRRAVLLTTDHKLFGIAQSDGCYAYNIWHGLTPDWVKD